MRLLKPSWVSHGERSLFCVDIHPDGTRFATGGQGQDRTGTIAVWNMAPLESETAEKERSVHRQLCRMDDHLGCVNCLRWSHSGKYLASGSDDKLVMIWRQAKTAGSAPFGSSAPAIEGWRAVATLRGHSGDVIDVAWSPRDVYLATGSVDNLVLIWDCARWGQPVASLKGHTGLVKGLDWDPIGKYLCSQSDDRSLRIWRTSDWRTDVEITEPYSHTSGTTAVLRCSWSPDGMYIVTAHAMNNGGPTALIVDRGSWEADKYFVGHQKAITCARFSSTLYHPSGSSGSSGRSAGPCCACALGSRDRGVSVWLTRATRPLVVVHELFDDSVMDLSWHAATGRLIACSKDGTVAALSFSPAELGRPLSVGELSSLRESFYGRPTVLGRTSAAPQIVESPMLLSARKAVEQQKSAAAADKTPAGSLSAEKSQPDQHTVTQPITRVETGADIAATTAQKQIERRTPDGKRRITPMFVSSQDVAGSGNISGERTFTSSTGTCPSVAVEKCNETVHVQVSELIPGEDAETPLAAHQESTKDSAPVVAPIAIKRRLEPRESRTMTAKRHRAASPTPAEIPMPSLTMMATTTSAISAAVAGGHAQAAVSPPVARNIIAPLVAVARTTASLSAAGGNCPAVTLQAENASTTSGPHVLKCLHGNQLCWRVVLASPVIALRTTAEQRILVFCLDSTLHIMDRSGRLLLPPMAMPGLVARVSARGAHVLVVTATAHVSTWDVQQERACVRQEPAAHLLLRGGRLTGCSLTEQGEPVLVLSTGKAYLFNVGLAAWLLLTDTSAPGAAVSNIQPQLPAVPASGQALAVLAAQVRRHCPPPSAVAFNSADDGQLASDAAATYLDSQVAAAAALRSPSEYSLWLSALVRQLASQGDEGRLRPLCQALLGPAHSGAALSLWQDTVLGLDKRGLLKQLLSLLVPELRLQRLYTEIKDQLDCLDMPL